MSVAAPPEGYPTTSRLLIGTFLMTDPERSWSPKEIQTATGLSRCAVRLGCEAFYHSRLLLKIPGNRHGRYRVRVTHYGVQQIIAWLVEHWTPELIFDMRATPQGYAVAAAFMESDLFTVVRYAQQRPISKGGR